VSEFNEHLRIEMLDPKYKEIKEEVTARAKDTTTAAGDLIAQNLQSFASKRPDLFGEVEGPKEDRTKGIDKIKKINLVEQKIIWDGQSTMMSRTSATHAMIA
jgi:splicing factor 3A subunit 1